MLLTLLTLIDSSCWFSILLTYKFPNTDDNKANSKLSSKLWASFCKTVLKLPPILLGLMKNPRCASVYSSVQGLAVMHQ